MRWTCVNANLISSSVLSHFFILRIFSTIIQRGFMVSIHGIIPKIASLLFWQSGRTPLAMEWGVHPGDVRICPVDSQQRNQMNQFLCNNVSTRKISLISFSCQIPGIYSKYGLGAGFYSITCTESSSTKQINKFLAGFLYRVAILWWYFIFEHVNDMSPLTR